MSEKPFRVLFVCLGNICRSPVAEGVMRCLVKEQGLENKVEVDSCGTGAWHVGQPPHPESTKVAQKYGVSLRGQEARQLSNDDFSKFDLIVAMDESNLDDIERRRRGHDVEICLLRDYDLEADGDLDVPDPYYGGKDGFENVHKIITRSCKTLLDEIATRLDDHS